MKYFLIIAFFVCNSLINAQTFQWAAQYGATFTADSKAIAKDDLGNVYMAGTFLGTADLNPGPGVLNLTSAGTDIFISKLDPSGNFLWSKKLGGSSADDVFGITLDNEGNVYTTGTFFGTADFDPGAGTFNMSGASGGYSIFISKLDSNGDFIWAKKLEGESSNNNKPSSIAIDEIGNILICGSFERPLDFDPGAQVFLLDPDITTGIISDIFVLKLDALGNFLWAKQMGGPTFDFGNSISTDADGNVYTTGYFNSTADFDPGAASFNFTSVSNDVFISKLDTDGNFLWAKQVSGAGADRSTALTLDPSGNVYITGSFSGPTDFDPGVDVFNLTSTGLNDAFILKLNSAGNFLWAKNMGGAGYEDALSISLDEFNNVYTTGNFNLTADFDPGSGIFNLISEASEDMFVSKLDSSGNFIGAKRVSGPGSQKGISIVIDNFGNILATGYLQGDATATDLDPDAGEFILTPTSGGRDAFVLKWNDFSSSCSPTSSSLSQTECGSYLFNNQPLTQSGTYNATLVNAGGCDSLITLNLTIDNIDVSVTQTSNSLEANGSGTFQWVNCDNNFSLISGATNQSFSIPSSGSFAVIVNNNSCIDTSACFSATVGLIALNQMDGISIYPNPSSDFITIKSSKSINTTATVYEISGRIISTFNVNSSEHIFNLNQFSRGIYILELNDGSEISRTKIIKK